MADVRADADRHGPRLRRGAPARARRPDDPGAHAAVRVQDDAGRGVRLPAGDARRHRHDRRHHVDPVRDSGRAHHRRHDRGRSRHGEERRGRPRPRRGDDELAHRRGLRRPRARARHSRRAPPGPHAGLPGVLHAGPARHHLRRLAERGSAGEGPAGRRTRPLAGHDRSRSGNGHPALHLRAALPLGRHRARPRHHRLLRDPRAPRDGDRGLKHREARRGPGRRRVGRRPRHLPALAPRHSL